MPFIFYIGFIGLLLIIFNSLDFIIEKIKNYKNNKEEKNIQNKALGDLPISPLNTEQIKEKEKIIEEFRKEREEYAEGFRKALEKDWTEAMKYLGSSKKNK